MKTLSKSTSLTLKNDDDTMAKYDPNLTFRIIIYCGFSDGGIRSFTVSNDSSSSSSENPNPETPVCSGMFHSSPVTAVDTLRCETLIHSNPIVRLISASYDGTICLSEVNQHGEFNKLHSINFNGYIRSISCRYHFNLDLIDCFVLDTESISKVILSASKYPESWNNFKPTEKNKNENKNIESNFYLEDNTIENNIFSETTIANMLSKPNKVAPPSELSTYTLSSNVLPEIENITEIDNELTFSNFTKDIIENLSSERKLSYTQSALLKPMTAFERIQTTDFQVVRKDKKLLDAFIQEDTLKVGLVKAGAVHKIISKWIPEPKISVESLWELINLMGISNDNEDLDFLKVTKIAVS